MLALVEKIKNSPLWRSLIRFQQVLMVLTSVFVVLIMCFEVLLRYVFKSDLFGIEEIVVIAAFWLYLIGSSYGVYDKSHVKADIIPQLLPLKAQAFLSVLVRLTTTVLCVVFSWWAVDMVLYSIEWMPRTTGLRIPIFISQISILVGYILMSFYSLVYFLEDLGNFLSFEKEDKKGAFTS